MEKLTAQQIIKILEEKIESVDDFAYQDFNEEELGLGEIKEVYQYGGEGDGSTWYSVKYLTDHDVYLRVDGWYQSYDGTEFNGWEDVTEVRPKQKTITVYE